jgi:hypothetical protein
MKVILDVQVVAVEGVLDTTATPPAKPIDFADALARLVNIAQPPPLTTTANAYVEAQELVTTVQHLAVALDECINGSENKQMKNKRGIELHGKIERAKSDLDRIERAIGDHSRDVPQVRLAAELLHTVTSALLAGIFGINMSTLDETPPTPTPKAAPKARTRKAVK